MTGIGVVHEVMANRYLHIVLEKPPTEEAIERQMKNQVQIIKGVLMDKEQDISQSEILLIHISDQILYQSAAVYVILTKHLLWIYGLDLFSNQA